MDASYHLDGVLGMVAVNLTSDETLGLLTFDFLPTRVLDRVKEITEEGL